MQQAAQPELDLAEEEDDSEESSDNALQKQATGTSVDVGKHSVHGRTP